MRPDPRLADLTSGKPQVAPDMPARKPPVAVKSAVPNQPGQEDGQSPVLPRRRRFRLFSGNGKWIASCGLCAFVGSLIGAFAMTNYTQRRVEHANQRMMLSDSIERLVDLGVDVSGDISLPVVVDQYAFPSIDFSEASTTREMRKAVRTAAVLPGVRSLNFCPHSNQISRSGLADETVLRVVGQHFPVLDTLDLSCTNVVDFRPLNGVTIRHLKIVNVPLIMESFTSMRFIRGVRELSIGWPDRTIPKDSIVRTDGFRKALVEILASMDELEKLHLYDMTFEKEEQEKLSKLQVTTARLGE